MNKKTVFLIDGFNLYHSIRDLIKQYPHATAKWLDIKFLCQSYLHLLDRDAILDSVYYFSAYAYHLADPGVVSRHQLCVRALESSGVKTQMSRFKPRDMTCPMCHQSFVRHDEKETDVAISTKLMDLAARNECEFVVLITGDTDIAPAVKSAKLLCPGIHISFLFPFNRKNRELEQIADSTYKIGVKSYTSHQFPNPLILPDRTRLFKPSTW